MESDDQYVLDALMEEFDLYTDMEDKSTATPEDWRRVMNAAYDPTMVFQHPRLVSHYPIPFRPMAPFLTCQRTQFILLFMIMTLGIARPGEIVTSDGYEPDNEGLQWKVSTKSLQWRAGTQS